MRFPPGPPCHYRLRFPGFRESNRALKLNPQIAQAYYNRGHTYRKKDDFDRALADFSRVVELNPKDAMAQYNKTRFLDQAGRKKEALKAYQSFLRCAPPQSARLIKKARERIKALEK